MDATGSNGGERAAAVQRRAWRWAILLAAIVVPGLVVGPGLAAPAAAQPSSDRTDPTAARAAGTLDEAAARGKRIYLEGVSPSGGEVVALMGAGETGGGVEVPASALPCGSCHGRDGRGRPEGGVSPSNITWPALTRSYGVRHGSGREHPAYDERGLKKAITLGVDPAGNRLDAVMPRYRLSHQDAADLVAYLRVIHLDRDPGIGDGALRLGTLLPPDGRWSGRIAALLEAYLEQLNEDGGVYGRRVELVRATPTGSPAERRLQLERFLADQAPFALVAPYLNGAEEELAAALAEAGVPAVGPPTAEPQLAFPLNRQLFYLHSGLHGQARALGRWLGGLTADEVALTADEVPLTAGEVPLTAGEVPSEPAGRERDLARTVTVVHPDDEMGRRLAQSFEEGWLRGAGETGPVPPRVSYPPLAVQDGIAGSGAAAAAAGRLLTQLSGSTSGPPRRLVLLDGGGVAVAFLQALARQRPATGWQPELLLVGAEAAGEVMAQPVAYAGALTLTAPTLPLDRGEEGRQRLVALTAGYATASDAIRGGRPEPKPPGGPLPDTLAAAQLLVEGLRRAGRDLSREGLIVALEGLYEHRTGLTRPLTYGPNRRVGASGAYLLGADLVSRRLYSDPAARSEEPGPPLWVEIE